MLAIAALLLTGCGGPGPSPVGSSAPTTSVATTPSPQPSASTDAEKTCLSVAPPGVKTEDVSLRAADGVRLNAIAVGTGPRGVVLLHQTDNGLCGWLPYAYRLAGLDFHVLAFDYRCTFGSNCPDGEKQNNLRGDVDAAVTALRRSGATQVSLVGASLGGAVAIGTCAVVKADRCVALSAAIFDRKLGGGLTANKAVGTLRKPLLFAVAPDDPDSPIDEDRALVARAPKGVVTFVELPAGAGHGWDTVVPPGDPSTPSAFAAQLEDFLRGR